MESSYLMTVLMQAAIAVKNGVINLAKMLCLVILISIPMFSVVLPYCAFMADNMMPADTPERLTFTIAGVIFGAILMGGIPAAAYWLYGRKLESHLWRNDHS